MARYECTGDHHQLVGEASRTCAEGGEWNHPSPTCVRSSCPSLAVPENGKVETTSSDGGGSSGSDSKIATGTVVKISCDLGYTMSVSEKGADSRTCDEEGGWSGAADSTVTCTVVACGEPPRVEHGSGNVEGPAIYGSIAEYSCDRGWVLASGTDDKRQCSATGAWSGTAMVCEQVLCKRLQAPRNGNMSPPTRATGEAFFATAFETVTFGCEDAYANQFMVPLATENLLGNTDGVLRTPISVLSAHQYFLGVAGCCFYLC